MVLLGAAPNWTPRVGPSSPLRSAHFAFCAAEILALTSGLKRRFSPRAARTLGAAAPVADAFEFFDFFLERGGAF
jgi:hypothetical protein